MCIVIISITLVGSDFDFESSPSKIKVIHCCVSEKSESLLKILWK